MGCPCISGDRGASRLLMCVALTSGAYRSPLLCCTQSSVLYNGPISVSARAVALGSQYALLILPLLLPACDGVGHFMAGLFP